MTPNLAGEPYPIHGDGWLQTWFPEPQHDNTFEMRLESQAFDDNPYAYQALQGSGLVESGLDQTLILTLTHTGWSGDALIDVPAQKLALTNGAKKSKVTYVPCQEKLTK